MKAMFVMTCVMTLALDKNSSTLDALTSLKISFCRLKMAMVEDIKMKKRPWSKWCQNGPAAWFRKYFWEGKDLIISKKK